MCTVTYIPLNGGFILTSSRDENIYRSTLAPKTYQHKNETLLYPKDELAGGTWIATGNSGRIACLLNGAFENHLKKEKYEKSRGQILLESFQFSSPYKFHEAIKLNGVEPFTLLMIDKEKQFCEFRWDGLNKYLKEQDPAHPEIWSSVTLYNQIVIEQRRKWFFDWIKNNIDLPGFDIAGFHSGSHGKNIKNDVLMKRDEGLQTLSISQVTAHHDNGRFLYIDLFHKKSYSENIIYES